MLQGRERVSREQKGRTSAGKERVKAHM